MTDSSGSSPPEFLKHLRSLRPRTRRDKIHLLRALAKSVPFVGETLSEAIDYANGKIQMPRDPLRLPSPGILNRMGVSGGDEAVGISYLVVSSAELSYFLRGSSGTAGRHRGAMMANEVGALMEQATFKFGDDIDALANNIDRRRLPGLLSMRKFLSPEDASAIAASSNAWTHKLVSYRELRASDIRIGNTFWAQVGDENPDERLFTYTLSGECGDDNAEVLSESIAWPDVTGLFLWVSGGLMAENPILLSKSSGTGRLAVQTHRPPIEPLGQEIPLRLSAVVGMRDLFIPLAVLLKHPSERGSVMEAAESVHFSVVDAWENRPFETLGPVWWPTYLQVDSDKSYPVHRFGSRPLARLNVYAEAGCCPHLSVDHGAGEFTLLASVLINGNSPFRARKSAVVLPVAVTNIKISEDDDYFTVMFCISISKAGNTLQLRGPSLLFRGQSLDLHVPEGFRGGTLSIRGFYLG